MKIDPIFINSIEDIEQLELVREEVYGDCANINDCSICPHKNEGVPCNLNLITRKIRQLGKEQE